METDIKNLAKYPEFHLLKKELLNFCTQMDDLSDIKIDGVSRITLQEEIFGRRYASEKVKEFLVILGMIERSDIKKIDKTFE